MAERKSVRLEKHQLDAIEDMVERGIADNESEAHRMCLNAGKREFGYENGHYTDTTLKRTVYTVASLLTVAGVTGLVFTFAYPVPARLPSFSVVIVGGVLFGVHRLLQSHEPKVSKRLKRLLGGETA